MLHDKNRETTSGEIREEILLNNLLSTSVIMHHFTQCLLKLLLEYDILKRVVNDLE